jgi:two-component sensor histidine kinase
MDRIKKLKMCFYNKTANWLVVLTLLTGAELSGQMPTKSEKELLSLFKENKPDSTQLDLLLDLAAHYLFKNGEMPEDLTKSVFYAKRAISASLQSGQTEALSRAQVLLGTAFIEKGDLGLAAGVISATEGKTKVRLAINYSAYHRWGGIIPSNLDSAVAYAKLATSIAPSTGDIDLEVTALKNLADMYNLKGNVLAAEDCLSKARQIGDFNTIQLPETHYYLSELHFGRGNFNDALRHGLEALRKIKSAQDSANIHLYYSHLASIYRYTGQFQKSIDYCALTYLIYQKKEDNHGMLGVRKLMVESLLKLNQNQGALDLLKRTAIDNKPQNDIERIMLLSAFGIYHMAQKQYTEAENNFQECIRLDSKHKINDPWLIKTVGQFYVESGQYEKSRPFLEKTLKNHEQSLTAVTKAHLYFLLFRVDSAAGNYLSAIRHLIQNKLLDDSIVQVSKLKEVHELQIQYETERKDQELLLKQQNIRYLENQAQLKQSNLKVANQAKNLTLGGIVLLSIIVLLLYNQYRVKQRKNLEISQKNIVLERLIHEKEWLLKEVHHRVKNNLHTVMSLLESQSAYLEEDALQAIKKSQQRVYAMSLIHQRLYQSENDTSIDMSVYLQELLVYLRDSLDTGQLIQFHTSISPISLDISKAIPIGLILNEAITNSIKYAFPNNRAGDISISMHRTENRTIQLVIADNGVGLPFDWQNRQKSSLGLKLMQGLSEDIQGKLTITVREGTNVNLEFREELVVAEHHSATIS